MSAANRRNLILVGSAVVIILAFLTNPDQATHLKAIREVVTLRKPEGGSLANVWLPTVKYNNYLVFSTVTFSHTTLTYGYFGQIQTTNGVGLFYGVVP